MWSFNNICFFLLSAVSTILNQRKIKKFVSVSYIIALLYLKKTSFKHNAKAFVFTLCSPVKEVQDKETCITLLYKINNDIMTINGSESTYFVLT